MLPKLLELPGLVYGPAMIRFSFMRSEAHPNWPLIRHLNGMTFLFKAVHGTLLAVLWRILIDPASGAKASMITQVGSMLGALAMRIYRAASARTAPPC